jgi:peptide/nickel transport system substrate-binding protein
MTTTRRTFIGAGFAAAVASRPARLIAQNTASASRTIRAVMHGDLRVFDPIWTTANMTAYHGVMVYDTLFGLDENLASRPQMVDKFGQSDDKLTWTFQLRDVLKFSDGSVVTADDVVASIRRWAARDGAGQHMMARVKDIVKKDDRSFIIALKEPYGLVIDALAKTATPLCFIMRKKDAETDPNTQVTANVGSGPFLFNESETKQGARYVYDRNSNYVPRTDAPSGITGAKVVKVDRVIWDNMPDPQTAMAALTAGEIDFMELPPIDLLPQIETDKNIKIDIFNPLGQCLWLRMNFLHPPFDKVEARQAMLYLVNQEDILKATFGNPKYYKTCGSNYCCGTAMANDENTEWFKGGQNLAKVKELFQKSGYDGRPVVVLQATNIEYIRNSADLVAQWLRKAGINVSLEASDWGGVVTRRSVKRPQSEGGWNIFITSAGGAAVGNPIALAGHAATGEAGWFGWPKDELNEKLRDKWAAAGSLEEQKAVARELQKNAWHFVPHIWMGQFLQPAAFRSNVSGWLKVPEIIPFWNIEKKA